MPGEHRLVRAGGAGTALAGQGEDRTDVRKIGGGDHYFYTPTHVPYACVIDFVLAARKNMTHSTLFNIREFTRPGGYRVSYSS